MKELNMSVKWVNISKDEYLHGGYRYTSRSGAGVDTEYMAKVMYNNDGSIDENSTFSQSKLKKQDKVKEKKVKTNSGEDKDGCLSKILKAPFKLLWWLLKKILIVVSLGMLGSWLNGDSK